MANSSCSISCGTALKGTKMMQRSKLVDEKHGGIPCGGNSTKFQECPMDNITCPRSCEWGEWASNWTDCSYTCGVGIESRRREIMLEAETGGKNCTPDDAVQKRDCNTGIPCPGTNSVISFSVQSQV